VLRYLDLVLVVLAAPVLLLIGVPALGYGVGAGAWIVMRAVGAGVENLASRSGNVAREVTARVLFGLVRVLVLALAIILVRRNEGRSEGLTTLLVVLITFTIQFVVGIITRPRPR
jgi:heme A synthase